MKKLNIDELIPRMGETLYRGEDFRAVRKDIRTYFNAHAEIRDLYFFINQSDVLIELFSGKEVRVFDLQENLRGMFRSCLNNGLSFQFISEDDLHGMNQVIGRNKACLVCPVRLNREIFGVSIAAKNNSSEFTTGLANFFEFTIFSMGPLLAETAKSRGYVYRENVVAADMTEISNPAISPDFFDELRLLREVIDNLKREISGINDPERRTDDINSVRAYLDSFSAFLDDSQDMPPKNIPSEVPKGLSGKLEKVDWTTVSTHSQGWANTIISAIAKYFGGGG